MLKLNYFLADIFILSAEKQPIKLSWRKIEWLLENKDIQLEYIGGLKEFYAQRIVNKIFNHALRIGVDLPHIK